MSKYAEMFEELSDTIDVAVNEIVNRLNNSGDYVELPDYLAGHLLESFEMLGQCTTYLTAAAKYLNKQEANND